MADRQVGTIKWFNDSKGFGFIEREQGADVFVHFRSIRGEGYRTLKQGAQVEFDISETDKGFQAEDVAEV
jgi:CspA family cold shock protein